MNALRLTAVATTLSVAVLGALMTPAENAQSSKPAQRIEVTGQTQPIVWVREGDDYVVYAPFLGDVAEQVGGIARSANPAALNTAAITVGNVR